MKNEMTSRERILTAMAREQPDRVPLYFNLFGWSPPAELAWASEPERIRTWGPMGVDHLLHLAAPGRIHPDVTIRSWRAEPTADQPYPLLGK